MRESHQKRNKGPNFSSSEVKLLLILVQKYKDKINCSQTDNKNEIRKEGWKQIARQFNIKNADVNRSAEALRIKYKNLKTQTKKKFSETRSYSKGTETEPSKSSKMAKVDEINNVQIEGIQSKYDDDRNDEEYPLSDFDDLDVASVAVDEVNMEDLNVQELNHHNDSIENDQTVGEEVLYSKPQSSTQQNSEQEFSEWDTYASKKLRQPTSTTPKTKNKEHVREYKNDEPLKTKIGNWAKSKIELTELQNKLYVEQHKEKLKIMRKKHEREISLLEEEATHRKEMARQVHEREMLLLQEESANRKEMSKQEHELKMEILRLQKQKYINIKKDY